MLRNTPVNNLGTRQLPDGIMTSSWYLTSTKSSPQIAITRSLSLSKDFLSSLPNREHSYSESLVDDAMRLEGNWIKTAEGGCLILYCAENVVLRERLTQWAFYGQGWLLLRLLGEGVWTSIRRLTRIKSDEAKAKAISIVARKSRAKPGIESV